MRCCRANVCWPPATFSGTQMGQRGCKAVGEIPEADSPDSSQGVLPLSQSSHCEEGPDIEQSVSLPSSSWAMVPARTWYKSRPPGLSRAKEASRSPAALRLKPYRMEVAAVTAKAASAAISGQDQSRSTAKAMSAPCSNDSKTSNALRKPTVVCSPTSAPLRPTLRGRARTFVKRPERMWAHVRCRSPSPSATPPERRTVSAFRK